MTSQQAPVHKRDETFASRTVTKIWHEVPSDSNPYLAKECRCHGFDLMELATKRSFADVFFLLFQGELPTAPQAKLLETLFILLINPGPRHPAVRAAMYAGVGKTHSQHLLPTGLSILGGSHLGGEEMSKSMEFLKKTNGRQPKSVAAELLQTSKPPEGDWHIAPGFGCRFGSADPLPQTMASMLANIPASGKYLQWGADFVKAIAPHAMGWLSTGVAAATFCDLGFHPRTGAGLFQLLCGPGILAHGLELANKPITAMPFLDEEHYVIAPQARKN